MIQYRTFRNGDPPALVTIWNEAFTTRGWICLRGPSPLEYFLFAKAYFDPAGLLLAFDGDTPVGFAHAGFGPNEKQTALSTADGVLCMIGVRPAFRRQGIGSELLRLGEAYLRQRGATRLYAGSMKPLNPFYFGLYGGSESSGFLTSEPTAEPFLIRHGYAASETRTIYHRSLENPLAVADGRFPGLRRRYEMQAVLRKGTGTWFEESVIGPVEMLEFCLQDKTNAAVVARAAAWEMQGFGQRWNESAVGIADLTVNQNLRRQGLGKFLLAQALKQVQDQYFSVVEIQASERDPVATGLFKSVGLQAVDCGRMYRKNAL